MLSSRLLKHIPEAEQFIMLWGAFLIKRLVSIPKLGVGTTRAIFSRYGCYVSVMLYVFIPKGFFPVQDTLLLQLKLIRRFHFRQWVLRNGKNYFARSCCTKYFISVDGTNSSLNTGRILINLNRLVPMCRRLLVICNNACSRCDYIFATCSRFNNRCSRTQYQFTVQSTSSEDLAFQNLFKRCLCVLKLQI